MTTPSKPWHGILVATALPMRPDARGELQPDLDEYGAHVAWLAANGCDGVVPNGSLGEYQTLSREDRARVVETAVAASPQGFVVMPGVAALVTWAGPDKDTIQYAPDGLHFSVKARVEHPPRASGSYRPDAFDDPKFGQGITWGICLEPNPRPHLQRFDCDLSAVPAKEK